jgi:hypothetical protein
MADISLTYGGCYWSTPTETANDAATPIKCAGTTSSMGLNGFSHTSNKLTYTGTATRVCFVSASFAVSLAQAGDLDMSIYKNGALVTGSIVSRTVGTTDIGAMAVTCLVSLATNDYVELWCEVQQDADDVTIENGVLSAQVLG